MKSSVESVSFKELDEKDLLTVKEIYDHYILHSTATWHTEPISVEELKSAIYLHHPRYKSYLVYLNISVPLKSGRIKN